MANIEKVKILVVGDSGSYKFFMNSFRIGLANSTPKNKTMLTAQLRTDG